MDQQRLEFLDSILNVTETMKKKKKRKKGDPTTQAFKETMADFTNF